MKRLNLDPEEKDLLESYNRGEWKRVKNYKEMRKMFTEAAKNTLIKLKNQENT